MVVHSVILTERPAKLVIIVMTGSIGLPKLIAESQYRPHRFPVRADDEAVAEVVK